MDKNAALFAPCFVHAAMWAQCAGALGFVVNPIKPFVPFNKILAGVAAVNASLLGMSRTMLKSVSGDAADLMVTQPEPTGQPAH